MSQALGRRYWFADEEREPDFPWFSAESYSGMCSICGYSDHRAAHCPNMPLKAQR